MCEELKAAIEQYLLSAPGDGWVKGADLCACFDISERQLRGVGDKPGLCSEFAISGDKGFKHVELASKAEYRRFKHRMRKHAVGEFRRTSRLDKRRNAQTITIKRPAFTFEKDTKQGVFL